jgi:hypothetical protein
MRPDANGGNTTTTTFAHHASSVHHVLKLATYIVPAGALAGIVGGWYILQHDVAAHTNAIQKLQKEQVDASLALARIEEQVRAINATVTEIRQQNRRIVDEMR